MAKEMGLDKKRCGPTVSYPVTPTWSFPPVSLYFYIQEKIKRDKGKGNWADLVDERLRTTHKTFTPVLRMDQ